MQLNLAEDYYLRACLPTGLCSCDVVLWLNCHIINSSYHNHNSCSKLYWAINYPAVDMFLKLHHKSKMKTQGNNVNFVDLKTLML